MDGKLTQIIVFLSAFFFTTAMYGFSVQISSTNVTCNGANDGTASANIVDGAGGTYSFLWSTGASGQTINSLAPGSYSVTATDATTGNTASSSVYISEPAALSLIMNASYETCDISGDGTASVLAFGGTPPYTILWDDPAGQSWWVAYHLHVGTYTVTITDANGCSIQGSATVEPSPEGIWLGTSTTSATCAGSCDGTAKTMPMTGLPPYTYQWSGTSQTSDHVTGLCAGTYNVTVTDANGCSAVDHATVNEPPVVNANVSSAPAGCSGANTGSATAYGSGGTPGYTYAWSNGGNTATIMDLSPGDYTVTVTDANGCTAVNSVNVGQSGSSNLGFTLSANDATCYGNCDGSASVTITSGDAPYSYNWSNNTTGNSVSGLCAGQYSVTVSDAGGCPIVQVFTISSPDEIVINTSATPANCGASDGTATATATGGNGTYTYTWSNGQTTATATGLAPGMQGVTVTDFRGCSASATVLVGQTGSNITADITSTSVSCSDSSDGTATVTVTSGAGNYTYAWSSGASGATATGLAAGSYSVTILDAGGCPLIKTITVGAPAPMVIDFTTTPATCGEANGSAAATVTGGTGAITYLWSNGSTDPSITGVSAGNYLLSVADANLCLAAATATVPQVGGLVAATATTTDVTCNGGSDGTATITVTNGTAPYTYAWENGGTAATTTGLPAGTQGWTVTDATGCMATGVVTISEPTAMVLTTSSENASCGGDNGSANVEVTGGTAPYTYKWNDSFGQTGHMAMSIPAGDYVVMVTDANGCTASASVTVGNTPGFTCNAIVASSYNGAHISSIGGNDGSATVTTNGGNPGFFSFLWSNGATTQQVTALSAGTYTVTVTDDVTGCTCESSVTLEDPAKLGNYVWIDANTNGIQDPGEVPVEGIAVQVTGTSAYGLMIDLSTTTDVNGMYMFTLPPGDYKVTFTLPANHEFTTVNAGTDDALDSDVDPAMGMTQVVTLTPGQYNPDLDAGLIKNCVSVGDFVWYDTDQNGIQDAGSVGVEGFVVNLLDAATGAIVQTTTTDANGAYLFDCVVDGDYKVQFDPSSLPDGYQFTTINAGNDAFDSDASGESGESAPFTVSTSTGDILTIDAGIHTLCDPLVLPGTIGYSQSICPGQVPDELVTIVEASGGSGDLEYMWVKSIAPGGILEPIPGNTNSPSYQPPALFETTQYKKCVRRVGCAVWIEQPVGVIITVKDTCGNGFVSITGSLNSLNQTVELEWVSGAENGDYTYQIERSATGEDFFAMDVMLGHGVTNGFNNYHYTDEHPRNGTNYYRVVMKGANGFEMSSDVIKIMAKKSGQDNFAIFPNPAGEVFYVDIMKDKVTTGQVAIYDANGKMVKIFNVEAGNSGPRRFLIPDLSSGVYFVKVIVDGEVKMMKLRKE